MTKYACCRDTRHGPHGYRLKVLQQPSKARLCSFKEKVDRRPIDPPPIVQVYCICQDMQCHQTILNNPYFFLYANLTSTTDDTDLYLHHGHRTTAGTVVQTLHKLKDADNREGGFFVFSDISVRLEGTYRLKFSLFEIVSEHVQRLVSVISDPFTVYSPKYFPGMSESSLLTRLFSEQGVRIRIRKDTRNNGKRQKINDDDVMAEKPLIPSVSSSQTSTIPTPAPTPTRSAMSMQNILSPPLDDSYSFYSTRTLPPPTRLLSHPLPSVLPYPFSHASSTSSSSSASSSTS